jgi:hypothetical protein
MFDTCFGENFYWRKLAFLLVSPAMALCVNLPGLKNQRASDKFICG